MTVLPVTVLTLIHHLPADPASPVVTTLSLTAAERTRTRGRHWGDNQQPLYLNLKRGTVLRGGDLLASAAGQQVRVMAKEQPVLTVTAPTPQPLIQAAYHLGNRHVPLQIAPTWLRLEPDSVLEAMLQQLPGIELVAEIAPFEPETGAYHQTTQTTHHHAHHPHD